MRGKTRFALAASVLAALIIAGAATTSAQRLVVRSGLTGPHQLADTRLYPSVQCLYDARNVVNRVVVEAPLMKARDRSAARDWQRLGWRFRVQRDDGTLHGWTTVATSAIQAIGAYDDTRAALSAMRLAVPGSAARNYRVVVSVFWYKPGTTEVQGSAAYIVDWYHGAAFEPSFGPNGYCPGGVF